MAGWPAESPGVGPWESEPRQPSHTHLGHCLGDCTGLPLRRKLAVPSMTLFLDQTVSLSAPAHRGPTRPGGTTPALFCLFPASWGTPGSEALVSPMV